MPEYDGSSAFLYRDKPIWVKGTDLIYDGRVVAQVTEGEKQFAIVNTKLCVFPDKIYVDVKTLEVKKLNDGVNSAKGAEDIAIESNQLEDGQINSAISTKFLSSTEVDAIVLSGKPSSWKVRTYGTSEKEVEECWIAADGKWDEEKLSALESIKAIDESVGYFVILGSGGYTPSAAEEPSKDYNTIGAYAKVTKVEDVSGVNTTLKQLIGNKYLAGGGAHKFTDVFKVGDAISVTGTRGGVYDTDKALLNGVEDNRLSFGGDVFKVLYNGNNVVDSIYAATIVRTGLKAGKYRVGAEYDGDKVIEHNRVILFEVTKPLPGRYSFITLNSQSPILASPMGGPVCVLDLETRTISEVCVADYSDFASDLTAEQKAEYSPRGSLLKVNRPNGDYVSFSKPYPELDFVCESENRL
jgi:hypothetical protein